ncbi:MAG: hypothetical protein COV67_00565 [Nitrospinae bacterium CG11_big_fil_rev_8_21_14_0_20_56_8]|nr:MAG: hypothetical protein COV67_00565 [Nitrospinae bacterium CG11_big_fil_rev_8_21_14_0_20_56_8]
MTGPQNSDAYKNYTYDMFMFSMGDGLDEIDAFNEWVEHAQRDRLYCFEAARTGTQKTLVQIQRETGEVLDVLNFSSYNYLGLGYHPEVIRAAQEAIGKFGLGAASSPVISGTYSIHKEFEKALIEFYDLPDCGVTLFSSGYGANMGTIPSFVQPGHHIVMDQASHMSIMEAARLSGARMHFFPHNDPARLETLLKKLSADQTRVLVCAEGVYSSDGDFGRLGEIVPLAKKYGAYVLVDEAHSSLIAGEKGRGVAEMQGVLDRVDLHIITFSKSFAGVGGALIANKKITQYVNWYAKCRLFSCALDPGVTGGMLKVLELARGPEGQQRRKRIRENADYLRELLQGKVELGASQSWIVTVIYRRERITLEVYDFIQRNGLDASIMEFPAVPKNEARFRMFVTSEHTRPQLERAAEIVLAAARHFKF